VGKKFQKNVVNFGNKIKNASSKEFKVVKCETASLKSNKNNKMYRRSLFYLSLRDNRGN
jgi:hypothetical protein